MFPLRQEGYLMLIRINKQHLILNEEMKREIGYFIKKHLIDTSSITFQVNGTENLLAVLALSGSRIEQEQITQIEEFIQNILVLEKTEFILQSALCIRIWKAAETRHMKRLWPR